MKSVLMGLAVVLGAAADSGCDRLVHSCTLIGCQDQVSLSLQREDGAQPGFAISLDIDGRPVECAAPQGSSGAGCGTDVQIWSYELQTCTEGMSGTARTLTCVPSGKFEEVITINGTPTSIKVTVRTADAVVADRTFAPQYKINRPNGPDCQPTCRQWGDVWIVPAASP